MKYVRNMLSALDNHHSESRSEMQTDFDNPLKSLLRRVFIHSSASKRNVKEAADIAGVTERCFYSWMDRQIKANIPATAFADVARYLMLEFGDARLVEHCMPPDAVIVAGGHMRPDGDISDEVMRATEIMGDLVHAWRTGDMDAVRVHASRLADEAGRMRAEAEEKLR